MYRNVKFLCRILVMVSVVFFSRPLVYSQVKSNIAVEPFREGAWQNLYPIPEWLQKGNTPEAREALNKLTPEQRTELYSKMREIFEAASKNPPPTKPSDELRLQDIFDGKTPANSLNTSIALNISGKNENAQIAAAEGNWKETDIKEPYAAARRGDTNRCVLGDADSDELDDCFERDLAASFTPFYHVSQGEFNNFSTFYNYVPQTVMSTLGQAPLSHYRVKPLGFITDSNTGQQYGVIRIDYLTLWDQDSGLVSGGTYCGWPIGDITAQLGSHPLDNERSAAMVYAPTSAYNVFSDVVSSYGARLYYTAAHEGTITDKSLLLYVIGAPIPSGSHLQLALSKSKHGTYPYNPNGLPLLPAWLMQSVLTSIQGYCAYISQNGFGWGDAACLAAIAAAYDTFYGCVVEVFQDQGGAFTNSFYNYNIGEPNTPMYGYNFIQDNTANSSYLYSKLINPVFSFNGW